MVAAPVEFRQLGGGTPGGHLIVDALQEIVNLRLERIGVAVAVVELGRVGGAHGGADDDDQVIPVRGIAAGAEQQNTAKDDRERSERRQGIES